MNNRGISLIESILAVVILSTCVAAIALFFPKASLFITQTKLKQSAVQLTNSGMQEMKMLPYGLIRLTPANMFVPGSNCNCDQVDFSDPNYPVWQTSEQGTELTRFVRKICVNRTDAAGNSYCPNQLDYGLKNIVVRTEWTVGPQDYTYVLKSLASGSTARSDSTALLEVEVCIGKDTLTNGGAINKVADCDLSAASNAKLLNADLSVYRGPLFITTQINPVPAAGTTFKKTYELPVGSNYNVRVQQVGYFPFHDDTVSIVSGGTTQVLVILRDIDRYGTTVQGEAYQSDHPVITRVVSEMSFRPDLGVVAAGGYANCPDATESLEIFNPTDQTYRFGCVDGPNCVQLQFFINSLNPAKTAQSLEYDFLTVAPPNVVMNLPPPYELQPGKYVLIQGYDNQAPPIRTANWQGANPAAVPPTYAWNIQPDILYKISDATLGGLADSADGLITRHGGGIILKVNGQAVDSIRWRGWDTPGPGAVNWANPNPEPNPIGVTWTDSSPLVEGSIQGRLCTAR